MRTLPLTLLSLSAVLTSLPLSAARAAELSAPAIAVSGNGDTVGLSWDAVDGAGGYRLHYTPYPYDAANGIDTLDLGDRRQLETTLWDGAAYYVALEAYDGERTSDYSNVEHFTAGAERIAFTSAAGSAYGLTLITPLAATDTYLLDDSGEIKHQWASDYTPALSAYLLEDGHLLRTGNDGSGYFNEGGKGGIIEELDWDGNAVWRFRYGDESKTLHHDIERLDDGHILALSWEQRDTLWSEVIVEIAPSGSDGGEVVWSWDVMDHLDELGLDTASATTEDWIHLNAIDYNRATDRILVSSRSHNQLWIINKADGSIAAISSVATTGQHDAAWIDDSRADSDITVFDNGSRYSRALELNPQMDTIVWSYGNADDEYFFSNHISGVQRLENGNTLVCSGVEGVIFELDGEGNRLREYTNPYGSTTPRGTITELFRAEKYASGYTPYF
ncbi:aryl-sulfate sulfotransferase [Endothiovibrio diazotrophicus]